MIRVYPSPNIKTSFVEKGEKKITSVIKSAQNKKYSDEQVDNIMSKIAECEALLKQFPHNVEARRTLDICKSMLKCAYPQEIVI